jgi:hypothetical protein
LKLHRRWFELCHNRTELRRQGLVLPSSFSPVGVDGPANTPLALPSASHTWRCPSSSPWLRRGVCYRYWRDKVFASPTSTIHTRSVLVYKAHT